LVVTRFLMLTIGSMWIDEIKNTQKNAGRGENDSGKSTEMRCN
jgi:hypothetical protein